MEPDHSPYEQPPKPAREVASEVPYGAPQASPSLDGSADTYLVPPGAEVLDRLEDAPRRVPLVLRLGLLSFSLWETFTVVIVLVAPMVVWIFVPEVFPPVALLVVVGVLVRRWRRQRLRLRLLRWGRVAQVLGATRRATSTSYSDVPMRQARGWTATTSLYTGSGYVSDIDWTLDGTRGSLQLRGLPYDGGVVLVDLRDPVASLELSQFVFDVRPDLEGRLVASVTFWQAAGVLLTLVVYGGVVGAAAVVAAYAY